MPPDEPLAGLARSVLEGTPVDWASEESRADASLRPLIRQLRLIEGLAEVHRRDLTVAALRGRWGHLEIRERIGQGACGAVFRAWDPRLDRVVALKLLPPARPDLDRPSAMIEEGRLLARVHHPNVVTIFGAEQIDDQVGLWMEFVEGETLEQILQRVRRFSPAETIAIGVDLCRAVSAVHAKGLLHRDIKANNVIKTHDGRVVLMDFGAGRELDDEPSSDLTGTPLYLAPEVFAGKPATVRSDLYCAGVLLYHLLTGAYPVEGRTIRDVRRAHELGERVTLRAARPDLPASLARAIDRAIDPDPSSRHPSVEAFLAELVALTRGPRVLQVRYVAAGVVLTAILAGTWWGFGRRAAPVDTRPHLAVLQFESVVATREGITFARGFAEGVQQNLARATGLAVQSFEASSRVPPGRSPKEAAAELSAGVVLDGDVSVRAGSLQVEIRLVRIADDVVLLDQPFEGKVTESFELQDRVSTAIAAALGLQVPIRPRHDPGGDLLRRYYATRALQEKRSLADLLEAAAQYRELVGIDNQFAQAWASLATSLIHADRLRAGSVPPAKNAEIQHAVKQALLLDPELSEALMAQGSLLAYELKWSEAQEMFLRALAHNPTATVVYTEFVLSTLLPQERNDDAFRYLEQARLLDKLDLDVPRTLAHVQVQAGQYNDAITTCLGVMQIDADFPWIQLWLGRAHALSGQLAEAENVFSGIKDLGEGYLGFTVARMKKIAEAEALAAKLADNPAAQMLVFGGLLDKERAFDALARLVAANPWRAATWMVRPEMKILRGDPRYAAIRQQLGLK